MRKFLVMLLFFLTISFPGMAQRLVPSKIDKVTVYPGSALIRRSCELTVKKGVNKILVETTVSRNLIDLDSIAAQVVGSGVLYGVEYKRIFLSKYPEEDVNQLQGEIKALQLQIEELVNKKLALSKEAKFLSQWLNFAQTKIKESLKTSLPSVDEVNSWLDFSKNKYEQIAQKITEIETKRQDLTDRLKVLKNKLNEISFNNKKEKIVFVVNYKAYKDENIKVYVSYLVRGVSWRPVYRVDVSSRTSNKSDKINILMQAEITQTTGELWSNVNMTISSFTPMRGVSLPVVTPWFIDTFGTRQNGLKVLGVVDGVLQRCSKDKNSTWGASPYAMSKSVDLGIAVEYKLPERVTVPSGGSGRLVPIVSWQKNAMFYYYAVPREKKQVYWVCEIPSTKDFLPGMMNVFVNGAFVGKTFIKDFRTQKKIILALGEDKAIRINRVLIEDKKKETFLGKLQRSDIVRKFSYEITITNLKSKPVLVKVIDALPVSKTDRIKVKNVVIKPKPTLENYQEKKGICLWQLLIPAKAKKVIQESFVIVYPRDAVVDGL